MKFPCGLYSLRGFRVACEIALLILLVMAPLSLLSAQLVCPQSSEGGVCPPCSTCPNNNDACDVVEMCATSAVRSSINQNISTCLTCTAELIDFATSCGMHSSCDSCCPTCSVPNPNSCQISSCPADQSLWDPTSKNCLCKPDATICTDIAGEVTRIGVIRWHTNNDDAPIEVIGAFRDLGVGGPEDLKSGGVAIKTSSNLAALSPCMEKARSRCVWRLNLDTAGYDGFASYRLNSVAKFLDACILSALEISGDMQKLSQFQTANSQNMWFDKFGASRILDHACQPIPKWKEDLIAEAQCNQIQQVNFNELASPVSLLWSSDVKIKEISSRSKFPLNPAEVGRWFVWKASGVSPLVVWDPEKKGVITHSNQLFGNHTWDKKWKNGYEPLATLDKDENGWLEGQELISIALWFDFNQDGISDGGEVKALQDVKVEAIGVRVSATDEKSGNVFADQGFRRKVSSGVLVGRSVDWFSASVEGQLGAEVLNPAISDDTIKQFKEELARRDNHKAQLAGFWSWRAVDPTGDELPENMPYGSFILYHADNEIAGSAYIASKLAPNTGGLAEAITRSTIKGEITEAKDGRTQLTFSTRTMHGGEVRSVAGLSDDGAILTGVTTEEQGPNKDRVSYRWVARRVDELK